MTTRTVQGFVDGPAGQIRYSEQGSGPAVVLVHMAGYNGRQFAKALPILAAAGMRAVALDLPGFGASDTPPRPPTVADYAESVVAVIESLGLAPAVLVGSHLGAEIVTELAVTRPHLAHRVVLVGPLPTSAEEREIGQQQIEAERSASLRSDGSHLTAMWDFTAEFFQGWTDISALQALITSQLAAGEHNWYGHNAVFSYDHSAALAQLVQPTLILTNTGDIAHPFSVRAHAAFPRFDFVELQGGTALIVDEQPEAWTAAVVEFARS